jgi:hypothetical protein
MKRPGRSILLIAAALLVRADVALAGMPSVTLSDLARMRIQVISFFAVCLLLSARAIQWIWNSLRADIPRLPHLGYRRAVGLVSLWGLLFLLVLTMISGARELMTPGAWKKEGYVFKLDEGPKPTEDVDPERRTRLESLRLALWHYAATHGHRFPPDDKVAEIPSDVWRISDPSGLRYVYVAGHVPDVGETPLAYEPGIFGKDRQVLMTDGAIRRMTLEEIRLASRKGEAR